MAKTEHVLTNGLSVSENRIRLMVEKNLDDVVDDLTAQFNDALKETADAAKLLYEKLRLQGTTDFQSLTDRILKIEQRQEYEATRVRLQSGGMPNLPVSPNLIGLKMTLDRVVAPERQDPLFAEMDSLMKRVEAARTTAEVQRLLYRAGDHAARYCGKKGAAKDTLHFEKGDVVLSSVALLAAGTVLGIGGTAAVRAVKARRQSRAQSRAQAGLNQAFDATEAALDDVEASLERLEQE